MSKKKEVIQEVEPTEYMGRRSDICRRCGRKLKTPASVEVGFGSVCYKKFMSESALKPLFSVSKLEVNEDANS